MGRLVALLDFSPADSKQFPTVFAVYMITIVFITGLVANDIRLTKLWSALFSRVGEAGRLLDNNSSSDDQ